MPDAEKMFENRLIDILGQVPGTDRQEIRDFLIRSLPKGLIQIIPRDDAAMIDLSNIVWHAKEWGSIYARNRFPIEIIIDNAKQLVQGTTVESKLETLRVEFQQSIHKEHNIRVVVVAMIQNQAVELDNEVILNNPEELENFKNLKTALQRCGIEDFTLSYGNSRDDWKPLIIDQIPIHEIIQKIVDKLNTEQEERASFRPLYLSNSFFSSDNREERRLALDTLEKYGGILIVDAISMYHPQVRNALINGQLIGKEGITMIVVSPLESSLFELNKLLEERFYSFGLERAFVYFAEHHDPGYELGVGNIFNLHRWLSSAFLINFGRRKYKMSSQAEHQMHHWATRKQKEASGGIGSRVIGRDVK